MIEKIWLPRVIKKNVQKEINTKVALKKNKLFSIEKEGCLNKKLTEEEKNSINSTLGNDYHELYLGSTKNRTI